MPGTSSRCTIIEIINDDVVEQRQESMLVRISNIDEGITVDNNRDIVFVTIEDDDSMWHKLTMCG